MNPHPLQNHWTEKAKLAMWDKARSGVFPGCAPLGYRNAISDGEKVIVPDPETAPKVRRLFELASTGKLSLRKMLPMAEEMGLRSRNGKPLQASSLRAILTNPFYLGLVRYKGELITGRHEPLVDRRLFEVAQR